ncbi:MAG: HEPN domain-containing protein [Elusimicrobia bacterium]|nr:HEPN domain-containing protein [Candidatus Liberimonas magnetica]
MDKKAYKSSEEWFSQADYDIETAKAMLKTRRYIYAVFMCHLSVEKALKGIYTKVLEKDAPKTHNLIYLYEQTKLQMPDEILRFVNNLNDLSIPTRYPDELKSMMVNYNKDRTQKIFDETKKVLSWLKEQL